MGVSGELWNNSIVAGPVFASLFGPDVEGYFGLPSRVLGDDQGHGGLGDVAKPEYAKSRGLPVRSESITLG